MRSLHYHHQHHNFTAELSFTYVWPNPTNRPETGSLKKKYQRHKNDQNTQNRCWQLPVQKNTPNSYKMLIKCNQKIYTYAFIENTVNSLNRSPNTTRHGKYQTFRYVRMRSYREYI